MKMLFVHDHKFHFTENGFMYSTGGLPSTVWSRYLKVFDSVTVVGRKGGLLSSDNNGFVLSSRENVTFNLLESTENILSRLKDRRKQSKEISKLIEKTDGLIVRLPSEFGFMAIDLAIKLNKKFVVEIVDCPWDGLWNHGSIIRKLYAPLLFLRMKFAVKKSHFSLYVTKNFLQDRYPSHPDALKVSCSNVDISLPDNKPLDKRILSIKKAKGKVTFGLVGTMKGKLKGIQTVLKALSTLDNNETYEFRILSSGQSKYYSDMATDLGVADNVFFDGPLPSGDAVFNWLDNVDIYLHPSYKEGLPRALIEAMSRGCPCIASNIAGIPELLDSDFLIVPGDYRTLSKKMELLSANATLQIGAACSNFEKSKNYDSLYLNTRRDDFFESYKNSL